MNPSPCDPLNAHSKPGESCTTTMADGTPPPETPGCTLTGADTVTPKFYTRGPGVLVDNITVDRIYPWPMKQP